MRKSLGAMLVKRWSGGPWVTVEFRVGELPVRVVSCHLASGASEAEVRERQMAAIVKERSDVGAFVVLGDLNVREDECEGLCEREE